MHRTAPAVWVVSQPARVRTAVPTHASHCSRRPPTPLVFRLVRFQMQPNDQVHRARATTLNGTDNLHRAGSGATASWVALAEVVLCAHARALAAKDLQSRLFQERLPKASAQRLVETDDQRPRARFRDVSYSRRSSVRTRSRFPSG